MTNDFLLKDARELLAGAEAEPLVQDYRARLPLSPIWKSNARHKENILTKAGSFSEALAKIQTQLFVHSESNHEAELAVKWNLAQPFARGSALDISSNHAPDEFAVTFGYKKYWHDDFRHFGTLSRIVKSIDGRPLGSIIELGAGAGNLAAMLKRQYPDCKYVIIDLPDTLVYSMMFLRATFPDATWEWLSPKLSGHSDGRPDFLFVPVGMESYLYGGHFDAFVNTASLGEMKNETVAHWFDFVQKKIRCDYIFSVNRFMNVVTPEELKWRRDENGHALQFDAHWEIIDWELEPDFLRCPWQNRHARQLLCFGKRLWGMHWGVDAGAVAATLEPALAGTWNIAEGRKSMTVQQPALATDFTKTGILYALWNVCRMSPTQDNAQVMLRYMRHLGGPDLHFEDYHFYDALGL